MHLVFVGMVNEVSSLYRCHRIFKILFNLVAFFGLFMKWLTMKIDDQTDASISFTKLNFIYLQRSCEVVFFSAVLIASLLLRACLNNLFV